MRPEFMTSMSCDSVYCIFGAAWSSRWLMTQLTNNERACVLVFVPVADILNIFCDINLFSLYLMNFMFHTMLDAANNILRVHYNSMKCDVSFSLSSVSTLFMWGRHLCHECLKHSSCLQQSKKLFKKSINIFQSYDHKCTSTFLWFTV